MLSNNTYIVSVSMYAWVYADYLNVDIILETPYVFNMTSFYLAAPFTIPTPSRSTQHIVYVSKLSSVSPLECARRGGGEK